MALLRLPNELLLAISGLCGLDEAVSLAQASRRLYDVASPIAWQLAVMDEPSHRRMTADAAEAGNIDILKRAAAYGADLNRLHSVPTPSALTKNLFRFIEYQTRLRPYLWWATPLHLAVYNGHYDTVRWLIAQGVDLDSPGRLLCDCKGMEDYMSRLIKPEDPSKRPCWTALHFAMCRGHESIARLLLSAGASVDTMPGSFKPTFENLAIPGFTEDVHGARQFLVETRACSSQMVTALHTASQLGLKCLATYLVQRRRMDANQADNDGWTPIFYAMLSPEADMVGHLVSLGANQNLRNDTRNLDVIPLGFAIKHKLPRAIKELVKAGASTWYGKRKKEFFLGHCTPSSYYEPSFDGLKAKGHLQMSDESQFRASVLHLVEATHAEYQNATGGNESERPKKRRKKIWSSHEGPIEELLQAAVISALSHPLSDHAVLDRLLSSAVPIDSPSAKCPKGSFGFDLLEELTTVLVRDGILDRISKRMLSTPRSLGLLDNILLLLRRGADPTNGWKDGDSETYSSVFEYPLESMLKGFRYCVEELDVLLGTAMLERMTDTVSEMGKRGAWDHPLKERRMAFYSDLRSVIGKSGDDTSYFRDRLRKLLKPPLGWEEELNAYEADGSDEGQ